MEGPFAGKAGSWLVSARKSYLETVLAKEQGVFVAASDFIRQVPEMIARWVPDGLYALGTDGFGRSDTRQALREL